VDRVFVLRTLTERNMRAYGLWQKNTTAAVVKVSVPFSSVLPVNNDQLILTVL